MTRVDHLIERRIRAVQLGLMGGLVMVVAGPEAADLANSVGTQSSVVGAAVMAALVVEHCTHPDRMEQRGLDNGAPIRSAR